MSIAGFTATSANRKFGVSDITKSRPLFFKEGYLNKVCMRSQFLKTSLFNLTSYISNDWTRRAGHEKPGELGGLS